MEPVEFQWLDMTLAAVWIVGILFLVHRIQSSMLQGARKSLPLWIGIGILWALLAPLGLFLMQQ